MIDLCDRSAVKEQFEKDFISAEMMRLLCGDYIGEGASRTVYRCHILPDCVIKFQKALWQGTNQNHQEYITWNACCDKPISKYLAPVLFSSHNHKIIIQKYCEPIQRKQFPKKLPKFLGDLKIENFGMLNNKVVCFDYGTTGHCIHKDLCVLVDTKDCVR